MSPRDQICNRSYLLGKTYADESWLKPPLSTPPPSPPPSYEESQNEYFTSLVKPDIFIQKEYKTLFGPEPQMAKCSNCGENDITIIKHKSSTKTNIAALLMFLSGLWCFCVAPYYINSLKVTLHHCSHCNYFLGLYDR